VASLLYLTQSISHSFFSILLWYIFNLNLSISLSLSLLFSNRN
jgi:hypothetical protein